MAEPDLPPSVMPNPAPVAARPSVIQLVFREKGALYAAYMPIFTEGGLFVPTTRDYQLGDDIYLLLTLPGDPQRYPVAGNAGQRAGRPYAGRGRAFPAGRQDPAAEGAHRGSARHLDLVVQAHADDLNRRACERLAG
jgi:type IV pilus assembly protein PilZ